MSVKKSKHYDRMSNASSSNNIVLEMLFATHLGRHDPKAVAQPCGITIHRRWYLPLEGPLSFDCRHSVHCFRERLAGRLGCKDRRVAHGRPWRIKFRKKQSKYGSEVVDRARRFEWMDEVDGVAEMRDGRSVFSTRCQKWQTLAGAKRVGYGATA